MKRIIYSGFTAPAQGTTAPVLSSTEIGDLIEAVDAIVADGILSESEKIKSFVPKVTELNQLSTYLVAKATSLSISSSALTSAKNAFMAYLTGLTPTWDNLDVSTPLDRTTLNTLLSAYTNQIASLQTTIQGLPGATLYTWVAYADNLAGTLNFTTGNPGTRKFMGIAVNKTTATESSNAADYVWTQFVGDDGDQGIPGPPGPNGEATYIWIAYADSADGFSNFTTGAPGSRIYMGVAANKNTATESTNAADYVWAKIQGPQGPAGPTGPAGPGGAGAPGITGSLTNSPAQVYAFGNGNVQSYTTATTKFVVYSGTSNVSSDFTLSVLSNPSSLTYTLDGTNKSITITGGMPNNIDSTTIDLRMTGTGSFASAAPVDQTFTIFKIKTGYEAVSVLPTTNLFESRMVYLTTDDFLYIYKGSAWKKVVDVDYAVTNIANGIIDASKFDPSFQPVKIVNSIPLLNQGRIIFNTADNRMHQWNGTIYVPMISSVDPVDAANISGQLADASLASIAASKILGALNNSQITSLAATKLTGQITDAQVAALAASKITGQMTDAQVAALSATKVTGQIVATQIADDSISTAKLSANAVVASKIAAGSIVTDKIAVNAITTVKIAAGAVETDKLAANSITAAKIVSGAVETDKIAANAVIASKIAAGAVEANSIAANAIVADKIAALAITSDKIAANAIVADKIAANSVTAVKIAANAITANKIAADAVTASAIQANSITSGKIAAGAVTTDSLAAFSITAEKLLITPGNLISNSSFETGDSTDWTLWDSPSTFSVVNIATSNIAKYGGQLTHPAGTALIFGSVFGAKPAYDQVDSEYSGIKVQSGEQYNVRLNLIKSSTFVGEFDITAWYLRADGVVIGASTAFYSTAGNLPTTWANSSINGSFTVPPGMVRAWVQVRAYNWTAGTITFSNLTVNKKASAELIVDGAITADKIATNAITANKIQAGAITATKIGVTDISSISSNIGTMVSGVLQSPSGGAKFDLTNARIIFNNGTFMKVTGLGFGSSNQFLEWFGPSSANLGTCTEANAVQYIKTNGDAYFGGSLSAGVLKNSVGSSFLQVGNNTTLGPFGTNGSPKVYVLSYSANSSFQDNSYGTSTAELTRWKNAVTAWGGTFTGNNTDGFEASGSKPVTGVNVNVTATTAIQGYGNGPSMTLNVITGTDTISGRSPIPGESLNGFLSFSRSVGGSVTTTDNIAHLGNRTITATLNSNTNALAGSGTQGVTLISTEE